MVALAEVVGDDDVGADGDAEEEVYEDADDGAVAADGGDGVGGGVASDDGDVDGVERLLEDAAGDEGHGEGQDFSGEGAVEHVHLAGGSGGCGLGMAARLGLRCGVCCGAVRHVLVGL